MGGRGGGWRIGIEGCLGRTPCDPLFHFLFVLFSHSFSHSLSHSSSHLPPGRPGQQILPKQSDQKICQDNSLIFAVQQPILSDSFHLPVNSLSHSPSHSHSLSHSLPRSPFCSLSLIHSPLYYLSPSRSLLSTWRRVIAERNGAGLEQLNKADSLSIYGTYYLSSGADVC